MQPAVVAKNHLGHLRAAAEIGATDASQLVTFRSSRPWAGASRLLNTLGAGALPVLFAVVDQGPEIHFRAWLQEVVLAPTPDDNRTQQLLLLRSPTTRDEDPWRENTKTLFAVSGCHEVAPSIPYSSLLKQSDGRPLSEDFGYSYALVSVVGGDEGATPVRVSVDVAPPPARTEAIVSRVVRDTALARRLKSLHNDQCQLCGTRLALPTGEGYSEAHHLQPLGRPHDGPDRVENVIVVCPNCHALCDLQAVVITPDALRVVGGHDVGAAFINYHNTRAAQRGAA